MAFRTLSIFRTGISIGRSCRSSTQLPIVIAVRPPAVACPAGARGFRSSAPLFDDEPHPQRPQTSRQPSPFKRVIGIVAQQLLAIANLFTRQKIPWLRDEDFVPNAERAFLSWHHAVFTERNPELLGAGLTVGGLDSARDILETKFDAWNRGPVKNIERSELMFATTSKEQEDGGKADRDVSVAVVTATLAVHTTPDGEEAKYCWVLLFRGNFDESNPSWKIEAVVPSAPEFFLLEDR
eukprot:TRINITY_DN4747_c0_g2_i1.p1 TRINITY_DN4747_c0_g2~~TRINITY_DN4747_c0_g2_i1.p1  ORF type:complete len:238 (-),score=40.80 TRINITY_DN4747_c0_g2_i1:10-723(-)